VSAITNGRDGRPGGPDQAADLTVAELGMVADQPGDSIGLVLALRQRRVAWPLGPADLVGRLLDLELVVRILLSLLDLLVSQLAGADRVAARQLGRSRIVGDRLHFQDVQAAEFGDLLERQRAVVDQPGCGRMGHQGLGHRLSPKFNKGRIYK
jgi:hypothetical protein